MKNNTFINTCTSPKAAKWIKMKKMGPKIILASFFLFLFGIWVLWFIFGKYADTTNYENRYFAMKPNLTVENYGTFANDYDSYFNDNLPFRNGLVTLNTSIDFFVFNTSADNRVIKGRNDWLFYSDTSEGNPIADYQGTNLFSDEELQYIAQNVVKQKEYLEEMGKEFVVFIAPNKERIYAEYMPEQYGEPAEQYAALQVYDYLKNYTDVRVVYPYEELIRAKETGANVYYKTDTHWNQVGGYVGAAALMKELGIEMPDILSQDITITPINHMAGDLANTLNLGRILYNTDWDYMLEGYNTHQVECLALDTNTIFSFRAQNADSRKIYVIRDSFSTAMAPYIGSQFNEAYLRHQATYSYEDFLEQDPDIVVREVVERYIGILGEFSIS